MEYVIYATIGHDHSRQLHDFRRHRSGLDNDRNESKAGAKSFLYKKTAAWGKETSGQVCFHLNTDKIWQHFEQKLVISNQRVKFQTDLSQPEMSFM